MGLRRYLSTKKQKLVAKLQSLKGKLKEPKNRNNEFPSKEKISLSYFEKEQLKGNISERDEITEKDSKIKPITTTHLSLPKVSPKGISIDASETTKEPGISGQFNSVPDGSRVLRINLMGGKIIEKVYLTPDGEKVLIKGNEL